MELDFFSTVPSDKTRGNGHKLKERKIFLLHDQTLSRFTERRCRVSVRGNTHNLTGHCPGQPAPCDPALGKEGLTRWC